MSISPMDKYHKEKRRRRRKWEDLKDALKESKSALQQAYVAHFPTETNREEVVEFLERDIEKWEKLERRARMEYEACDQHAWSLVQDAAQVALNDLEPDLKRHAKEAEKAKVVLMKHWADVAEAAKAWIHHSYQAHKVHSEMFDIAHPTGAQMPKTPLPILPSSDPDLGSVTLSDLARYHAGQSKVIEPGRGVRRDRWQEAANMAKILRETVSVAKLEDTIHHRKGELRKDPNTGEFYCENLLHPGKWEVGTKPEVVVGKAEWPSFVWEQFRGLAEAL